MIADPTGRYVYIVNEGDATISQYSVGSGGVLSALSPATVNVGAPFPSVVGYFLSVNPVSHCLYVVMTPRDPAIPLTTSIAQYAIGNDGTLSPLSPGVVDVSTMAGGALAVDPSGAYAYLAGQPGVGEAVVPSGEVLQFSVAANGALTLITSPPLPVSPHPVGVTISPSGRFAYVLSTCIDDACDGQVAEYTLGGNGVLTATGTPLLTAPHVVPISLLTDTAESGAYLLTNLMGVDTNAGAVYQFAINSTGVLVPDSPASLNVSSGSLTQGILGPNLYALSSNVVGFASGAPTGGHIDHYSIGAGGLLTTVDTTPVTAGYPLAMAVVAAP